MATDTEEDGDIIDLVAAESVPGSQIKAPSPPEVGVVPGEEMPDLESDTKLNPNIVRFVRPKMQNYVEGNHVANSLDEYIQDAIKGAPPAPGAAPGTPCTNNCARLYAASRRTLSNKGVSGYINGNWSPGEVSSVPNFFLAQMNVIDLNTSIATNAEWVGAVFGRNPTLSDNEYRLFSEFYTQGTDNTGNYVGGWSGPGLSAGFVPLAGVSVALFNQVNGTSTVGGTQYARKLTIEWYSASTDPCGSGCTGAWWLAYGQTWFGYYPVGSSQPNINFDRITSSAPSVDWYGEVYDSTPTVWTTTDMGSNQYAINSSSGNSQNVGYFRLMSVKRASNNAWISPAVSDIVDPGGDDPDCYTRHLESRGSGWETTMWFGGPGRNSTNGCDPF